MALYAIVTTRSDMMDTSIHLRRRIDAARLVYSAVVWGVMQWASMLDRPIAYQLVGNASKADPDDVTEFGPFTVRMERLT